MNVPSSPRPRSTGAKITGWIVALFLLVGAALLGALLLTWLVDVLHGWWPAVPVMLYSVALRVAGLVVLAAALGQLINMLTGFALGTTRRTNS